MSMGESGEEITEPLNDNSLSPGDNFAGSAPASELRSKQYSLSILRFGKE
jgi:hypothetical protein